MRHIPARVGIINLQDVRAPRSCDYAHIAGYVFFHSTQEGCMSGCATGAGSDVANRFNINIGMATRKYIEISMTDKVSQHTVNIANIYILPQGSANYNDDGAMQNLIEASAVDSDMNLKPTEHMLHHLMCDDLPPLPRGHKGWRARPCARAQHIGEWTPGELKLARPRCSGDRNTRNDWGTAATQTIDWFWTREKLHMTGYGTATTRSQRRKWRGTSAAPPNQASWRNYIEDELRDKNIEGGGCGAIDWLDRATR